jgi:hypothetical protein
VFHWVSRKANGVAHALVKFAALNKSFVFCNQDSLSLSLSLSHCKRSMVERWTQLCLMLSLLPWLAKKKEKKKLMESSSSKQTLRLINNSTTKVFFSWFLKPDRSENWKREWLPVIWSDWGRTSGQTSDVINNLLIIL